MRHITIGRICFWKELHPLFQRKSLWDLAASIAISFKCSSCIIYFSASPSETCLIYIWWDGYILSCILCFSASASETCSYWNYKYK